MRKTKNKKILVSGREKLVGGILLIVAIILVLVFLISPLVPILESPVATPVSPVVAPRGTDAGFGAAAEPGETETPGPTPTHWTSWSVLALCAPEGVDATSLELYYREGTLPLLSLNFNVQLRDSDGDLLMPQASLNLIHPASHEECEDFTFDYDWRYFEDDPAIPAGIVVHEHALVSYQMITTDVVYVMPPGETTPVPWNASEQELLVVDSSGTPVWTNDYVLVRSFEWASPTPEATDTPTATNTPTATPEPPLVRIYLPLVFKYVR